MDVLIRVGRCELNRLPGFEYDAEGLLFNCFSCIRRSMAWLPLDTATDAGPLITIDGLAGEHGLNGCTEIMTCDWLVVARAAIIELSMVGQTAISIKKIEFWSTGGAIGFRDILGLVVTEWKSKTQALSHFFKFRRGIVGIADGIIAADGDDP